MLKNFLLAGAATGTLAWPSIPARAGYIVANQWYAVHVTASSNPLMAPAASTSNNKVRRRYAAARHRIRPGRDDHGGSWWDTHGQQPGRFALQR